MSKPLHSHGRRGADLAPGLYKVGDERDSDVAYDPSHRLQLAGSEDAYQHSLFAGFIPTAASNHPLALTGLQDGIVGIGDVIRLAENGSVHVLYRRGANANSLFVTERCNSLCLMCSQPPRDEDDSWRLGELFELVDLIDRDLPQLGITGGEPTLLGNGLVQLLQHCHAVLPETDLHILSNGRRFGTEDSLAEAVTQAHDRITWAIPLYGPTADIHDYVVQSAGAFDQTIAGLYTLAELHQSIELRFVAHAATMPTLQAFAQFVARSLPFVRHIALMGLEPMGFTKMNRDRLWVDPIDLAQELSQTAQWLSAQGFTVSIYNIPLCVLPSWAWRFARQSISDWKNTYAPECEPCAVKDQCCGFFTSAGPTWRSRAISPIFSETAA